MNVPTPNHDPVEELLAIGKALASERQLDLLLDRILETSRKILCADAASLFLVERDGKEPVLRFKLTQNASIPILQKEFDQISLPINENSLVGYVAQTKEVLRMDDVYQISTKQPFSFNPEVDEKTGYRSKSLLSVPMMNHQEEVIGVVQVWNKKKNFKTKLQKENIEEETLPFSSQDQKILLSLAAQAGIALENSQLYAEIQRLFEGFIRASVLAIESRDPTTRGHSERVACLTVGLAKEVHQINDGPYQNIKFTDDDIRQMEYAALLHDFGKIGVRESVLLKSKKLFPHELGQVLDRFEWLLCSTELEHQKKLLEHLSQKGKLKDEFCQRLEMEHLKNVEQIRKAQELVMISNEPSLLPENISKDLQNLTSLKLKRADRSDTSVVSLSQIKNLSIRKGTLSEQERKEIQAHVTHTYEFLSQIPWKGSLTKVPEIAYAHHEKLDGSGYPRQLNENSIPLPSKIMAVVDIFDALAARDRPYKKAVPTQKALDILKMEANDQKLDSEMVQVFIQRKVYRLTNP